MKMRQPGSAAPLAPHLRTRTRAIRPGIAGHANTACEKGVDRDTVQPRAGLRLAAEPGKRVPYIAHDLLKEIFHLVRGVEISETDTLDGRLVPLEEFPEHPLALRVIHCVKPIRYRLAGFLTSEREIICAGQALRQTALSSALSTDSACPRKDVKPCPSAQRALGFLCASYALSASLR